MRLIDADDFLDLFYVASAGQDKEFIKAVEMVVEDTPTIDAEPVRRGRWIDDMYFDEPVTRCTWCNHGFAKGHKAERFPYCPNCGAKMDGENE